MLYQNYTRGQIKTFFDGVFLCVRTQGSVSGWSLKGSLTLY